MNLKECQGLQVSRSDPGGSVSSFGGILISTHNNGICIIDNNNLCIIYIIG